MNPEDRDALWADMGFLPRWHERQPHTAMTTTLVSGETPTRSSESLGRVEDSQERWHVLSQEIQTCQSCILHKNRLHVVPGEGSRHADWFFIGEGPGRDEDQQGRPFVGRAGKLLDSMLMALSLDRHAVYIANAVKCRPPDNRTPFLEEMKACFPFLARQIAWVAPKIIVLLGKSAALSVLGICGDIRLPLSDLRQKIHKYNDIPVIVTYHPAYLLRQPMEKKKAWSDLVFANRLYRGLLKP